MLIATTLLYITFLIIGFYTKKSKYVYVILPLIYFSSLLNAVYYLHLIDNCVLYYEYRKFEFVDYVPAFSGLVVGFLFGNFKGIKVAPAKAVIFVISLYGMFLPVAKNITNPLVLYGPENYVENGKIIQRSNSTCGPCSLAVILNLYGIRRSEDEIALKSNTSASGTELWYLARYARNLGFDTKFVFNADQFYESSIAGIYLGQTGHFISIIQIKGDDVVLHDSTVGLKTVSKFDLRNKFKYSGISLIIKNHITNRCTGP